MTQSHIKSLAGCFAVLATLLLSNVAHAALVEDINRLRTKGCGNQPPAANPLRSSSELNAVARAWSEGGRLRDALAKAKYPVINSASMRVAGSAADTMILKVLAENYCAAIAEPGFIEIGLFRSQQNVWIVVAAPFLPPAVKDSSRIASEVLGLVNRARSQPRQCGGTSFAAATALTLSAVLNSAALMQAQDMAAHHHFEHVGTDGSTPAQRVTRAGYRWRSVAENIASGPATSQQAMQGWLESPGHCANIMSPAATQMGIAYAVNAEKGGEIYWAQVFAAPM